MNLAVKTSHQQDPAKYLDEWKSLQQGSEFKRAEEFGRSATELTFDCSSEIEEDSSQKDEGSDALVSKQLYSDYKLSLDAAESNEEQTFSKKISEPFSFKSNSSEKIASSEENLPLLNSSSLLTDDKAESKVTKTGFDFLDNW